MNAPVVIGFVVAAVFAALAAWRANGARHWMLVALHALALTLLWFFLFPPPGATSARTLVVITPGASGSADRTATVVALPGATASAGVERVPDLATALRRHDGIERLRIVGDGLPARDRDAARGLGVVFDAPPEPGGIVELALSEQIRTGGIWRVTGRIAGVPGGRVELRDPAGAVVASVVPGSDGAYALSAQAKQAGRHRFELRVQNADGAIVDTVALPLVVDAGDALRVRLVAGGPDPEVKYLRRWAADAGIALASRIALSTDLALRRGDAAVDAAALADTDLVVIDERAWAALDAAEKTALAGAVDGGLGLMLRVTGPLDAAVAADWAAYGYTVRAADIDQTMRLSGTAEGAPALTRLPVEVEARDATPLVADATGAPLVWWRSHGRGRVAVSRLVDSYRLALADAARYGTLWANTTSTLARARGTARLSLPAFVRAGERGVVCGAAQAAELEDPQGRHTALAFDVHGAEHCAAFWPAAGGWHRVVTGDVAQDFYVRAADEAGPLVRAQTIAATRALVGEAGATAGATARGSRWPFFFGWLVVVALAWTLEKRRQ